MQAERPLPDPLQKLRALLDELRPMAAYGVVGSRDVEQARYQRTIAELTAALASLQALPIPKTKEPSNAG